MDVSEERAVPTAAAVPVTGTKAALSGRARGLAPTQAPGASLAAAGSPGGESAARSCQKTPKASPFGTSLMGEDSIVPFQGAEFIDFEKNQQHP